MENFEFEYQDPWGQTVAPPTDPTPLLNYILITKLQSVGDIRKMMIVIIQQAPIPRFQKESYLSGLELMTDWALGERVVAVLKIEIKRYDSQIEMLHLLKNGALVPA